MDNVGIVVESLESLSGARLRADDTIDAAASELFEQALLASVTIDTASTRYHYEAVLPPGLDGKRVQVLVGTLRGGVASSTFVPGGGQ